MDRSISIGLASFALTAAILVGPTFAGEPQPAPMVGGNGAPAAMAVPAQAASLLR